MADAIWLRAVGFALGGVTAIVAVIAVMVIRVTIGAA